MSLRATDVAVTIATAVLLFSGAALAVGSAPASFPSPPPQGADHYESMVYCDSVRAFCLRALPQSYRAGERDDLRAAAARWEGLCGESSGVEDATALRLLLAAGDDSLDGQHVSRFTVRRMERWRDAGKEAQPRAAAFRSMIADMATQLAARDDLSPSARFVAEYYAGQDVQTSDLRGKRYRGTELQRAAREHDAGSWVRGYTVGDFGVAFSSDFTTYSLLDYLEVWANSRQSVVFEPTFMRLVSVVQGGGRKTSEGEQPVNAATTSVAMGASLLMAEATSQVFGGGESRSLLFPWSYLWFAPNSRLNFRLGGPLWLSASTHTEFVLVRGAEGERGILFSPRIGLVRGAGLPPREWSSIAFSVGPQYWWSFEERSGWHGVAASVQLEFVGI